MMTTLMALAVLAAQNEATPEEIRLRVGIVGGKVGPTVTLEIDILAGRDAVSVRLVRREKREEAGVAKVGTMPRKEFDALCATVKKIWSLPVEQPEAVEDIYGMNTGVRVKGGEKTWKNGGPGGCVHGKSTVQPTDEQKKTFRGIVEAIIAAGEKHATKDP